VPKTIDYDLSRTAVTFGFDSAVSFATECIDRLHTTAASHRRVREAHQAVGAELDALLSDRWTQHVTQERLAARLVERARARVAACKVNPSSEAQSGLS
jgi:hypothetical protein